MGKVSFENYARRAQADMTFTEKAGRHEFQRRAEAAIIDDVIAKLVLAADDDLLEIGCGAGNLLIPLSFRVNSSTGLDHTRCIAQLRERFSDPRLSCIEGNFLDVEVAARFSKILVYSVIHLLADHAEVRRFLHKALALLKPGGRMLVGDIPNADRTRRFLATEHGKRIDAEYRKSRQRSARPESGDFAPSPDDRLVSFGDADLAGIVSGWREQGREAFLLPQPLELPFAYTREDLLIYG